MRFLLDSNICIGVIKGEPALVRELRSLRPSLIVVPSVVRAELYYGVQKSRDVASNRKVLGYFLEPFTTLPFDDAAAMQYGMIRSLLERLGTPIGPNDLMIAAIGMANDLTVVTRNTREFGRVVGLRVDQW